MSLLICFLDESEQGRFLGVGGFYTLDLHLSHVVAKWHEVKESLELDKDDEIKWNLPSRHPTRIKLEARKQKTRCLVEKAISAISSIQELTCLTVVMWDKRNLSLWRQFWQNASARDFYCEGMRYILQRIGEEVENNGIQHAMLVVDTPSLGCKRFYLRKIKRGPNAVYDSYREAMEKGVGVGPGRQVSEKPLRDLGFYPSVLVSKSNYDDLLQIADFVTGCITSWVKDVHDGCLSDWLREQVKVLLLRARRTIKTPFGDGVVVFPQDSLIEKLKRSLSEMA